MPKASVHNTDIIPYANEAVKTLLDKLVDDGAEIGIQVSAYLHGRCVIDTWAGQTSADHGNPVNGETLFSIFSVIKGIITAAAHIQAEKGLLDIDAPIATYWPDFAVNGKEKITLRDVLSHRSGLPQMPVGSTIERVKDWNWITSEIARLKPYHEPGTQGHYHAMTYGWLVSEAVRRTDPGQRDIGTYIQQELCAPLAIENLFLTVPEQARSRVAILSGAAYPAELPDESPFRLGIPRAMDLDPANFNRPDVQSTLIPAVGGYANARSVAAVYALLANGGELDGVRLLSRERVRALSIARPDTDAPDPFLGGPARLSSGGYMLGGTKPSVGSRSDTLFSIGAGGSIAWADIQQGLAVAITHNKMYYGITSENDPALAIGNTIREALRIPG